MQAHPVDHHNILHDPHNIFITFKKIGYTYISFTRAKINSDNNLSHPLALYLYLTNNNILDRVRSSVANLSNFRECYSFFACYSKNTLNHITSSFPTLDYSVEVFYSCLYLKYYFLLFNFRSHWRTYIHIYSALFSLDFRTYPPQAF